MGTITTDAPGFTERAQKLATELARECSVYLLCEMLTTNNYVYLPPDNGLSPAEKHVAIRSALAARLMHEGVLHIPGGG